MSQNQCKCHIHTNNEEMTILILMHHAQQHNDSTSLSNHSNTSHTNKKLITLPFYFFFFVIRINQCEQVNHHQFPLLPNIYHKEMHKFHTLNKGLEIHLPQFIEQSLWDFSLSLSLGFQINPIYSNK